MTGISRCIMFRLDREPGARSDRDPGGVPGRGMITPTPGNSTFPGGSGGGVTGDLDIHEDEYQAGGSLGNPTGEIRPGVTGLTRITLSGAPADLAIAGGRLLARE